jgi:tetratricopeptide (TPR) repeat protein
VLAPIRQDLGAFLNTQNRFEEGRTFSYEAIAGYRACSNKIGEACALDNVAYAEAQLGEHGVARQAFEAALQIWAHLQMPDRQAGTNERLGTLFFVIGHYDEAFYNFQQSLKAANRAGIEQPYPGPAEKCAYIARMREEGRKAALGGGVTGGVGGDEERGGISATSYTQPVQQRKPDRKSKACAIM